VGQTTEGSSSLRAENFLNNEEVNNLQDMMNYAAASVTQTGIFPIDSLYKKYSDEKLATTAIFYTNDKIDKSIQDILKS
jgi:hypothetical protein